MVSEKSVREHGSGEAMSSTFMFYRHGNQSSTGGELRLSKDPVLYPASVIIPAGNKAGKEWREEGGREKVGNHPDSALKIPVFK